MSATPTPQQQTLLNAEACRRVGRALAQIESAQNRLNDACATLSSLQYAAPEWKATGAVADRVRRHWYRVRNSLELGPKARKVRLDPLAAETILARQEAPS